MTLRCKNMVLPQGKKNFINLQKFKYSSWLSKFAVKTERPQLFTSNNDIQKLSFWNQLTGTRFHGKGLKKYKVCDRTPSTSFPLTLH